MPGIWICSLENLNIKNMIQIDLFLSNEDI